MSNNLKYAGIAVLGGVAGAVLGILYAPASGKETRRRIADGIDAQREALSEGGRAVLESVREGRKRLAAVVNG